MTEMITRITPKVSASGISPISLTGLLMKETSVFLDWNFDLQHFEHICQKTADYSAASVLVGIIM